MSSYPVTKVDMAKSEMRSTFFFLTPPWFWFITTYKIKRKTLNTDHVLRISISSFKCILHISFLPCALWNVLWPCGYIWLNVRFNRLERSLKVWLSCLFGESSLRRLLQISSSLSPSVGTVIGYLFYSFTQCWDCCWALVGVFYSVLGLSLSLAWSILLSVGTPIDLSLPKLIVNNQILFAPVYCWLFEIHLHVLQVAPLLNTPETALYKSTISCLARVWLPVSMVPRKD